MLAQATPPIHDLAGQVRGPRYAGAMDPCAQNFGPMLRRWRERLRLSQMDVALAAQSSTRHLSYLETGRAQPSREMIGRLAEVLDLPLRGHNALLLAAGFAPAFRESALDALPAAKAAMERVVQAHRPYPAFVVDRQWNIVLSNGALPQLYEGCARSLMEPPVNAMRLMLHPEGMAPRILNYEAWRGHCLHLLRQQIDSRAGEALEQLHAEVAGYPAPRQPDPLPPAEGVDRFATPLRIATRLGPVSFFSTITVFGTAHDVTLSELALEMLFPGDEQTARIVRALEHEQGSQQQA